MPTLLQSPPPAADIDTPALLAALIAFKKGDFSVRLPIEWTGIAGKVADAVAMSTPRDFARWAD